MLSFLFQISIFHSSQLYYINVDGNLVFKSHTQPSDGQLITDYLPYAWGTTKEFPKMPENITGIVCFFHSHLKTLTFFLSLQSASIDTENVFNIVYVRVSNSSIFALRGKPSTSLPWINYFEKCPFTSSSKNTDQRAFDTPDSSSRSSFLLFSSRMYPVNDTIKYFEIGLNYMSECMMIAVSIEDLNGTLTTPSSIGITETIAFLLVGGDDGLFLSYSSSSLSSWSTKKFTYGGVGVEGISKVIEDAGKSGSVVSILTNGSVYINSYDMTATQTSMYRLKQISRLLSTFLPQTIGRRPSQEVEK